jgi:hypothetical protein
MDCAAGARAGAVTAFATALLLALAPVASATHNEPLRGQWHLDGAQCGDVACIHADSSGHGLDASEYGTPQAVAGRFGGALRMPDKASYADAGNQPLLQPAAVTLIAWVRASSTPGVIEYVASQGANGGCSYASYAIYTGDDVTALRFYVATGAGLFVSPRAGNTMWDGAWHMTAGTYDGATVRFYVDGVEVGAGTPASGSVSYGLAANNSFTIGNFADPPECFENTNFSGDVDEVRVYSRALTATEIGRLAAATGPTPPDLVPDSGGGPGPAPPPSGAPPIADYTPNGISVQLTGALSLSAQSSVAGTGASQISNYHWAITGPDKPLNFDCGGGATTMAHPFRKTGTYQVALTITDSIGQQATKVSPLTVGTTDIVPKLKDPYIFACVDPPEGQQADRPGCVKSFGFGIVDVNSRGGATDCFEIVARINPGIFAPRAAPGGEQVSPKVLQVYNASIGGPVAINGIYLPIPKGVKTAYDSYESTIGLKGADSISLQIGPIPTQKIPLVSLKVTPDKHGVFHVINVDESANAPKFLGGLPIRGALSVDLIRHASKVKIGLGLPSMFSFQGNKAAQGDAYLISDNATGAHFDGLGLLIPEVFVGPLYVTNLSFKYIKSENVWSGGAKVTLPGSPISIDASSPPPDFGFGLKNGKFDHAGFGVVFEPPARPDLFPPFHSVLLTHIGAAIGLNPLRLTGTIGLSSAEVVDEDGVLFGAFASSTTPYEFPDDVGEQLAPLAGRKLETFSLAIGGTASLHVPVLGVLPLLNSYGLYEYPDYFEFGGGFSFGISFLQIDGGVKGFVFASQKLFNLEGGLKACLRNIEIGFKFVSVKVSPCLNVGAVISSKGLGFCGIVPVPFPVFGVIPVTVGAGYHWGDSIPHLMLFTCDYGPYKEVSPKARAAADAARAVDLPAGLPAAMIRVRGDGGPPEVTVTDPKGNDAGGSEDTLIVGGSDANTTLVALRRPAAGRWTIAAKDGSPPITDVASANGLPKLAIKARVRKQGLRRVLAYRVTGGGGRTIRFAERGSRGARVIGIARGPSGTIAFMPAPGRGGKRSILALVEGAAGPGQTVSVTSYSAPAPRRPGRPARVHVVRRKGTIRVTWRRVRGISRYEVLVELADGDKLFRVARRNRIKLADPFPRMRGRVLVDALAADGSRSAVRAIRLRGSPRR